MEPPEDTTTDAGTRYQLLEQAGELVWPLIVVLSEVVSEAITTLSQAEPQLMSKLADELAEASELRREAERLRAEARQWEWQVDRTARWLMDTADGGVMATQPRPMPETPPRTFDGENVRLSRPWWRRSEAA